MTLSMNSKLDISLIIIFLGSVFITSEKFINTINSPKFYFTIVALLILLVVIFLKNNDFATIFQFTNSFTLLRGIYIIGVFQSIYGILQFIGKCSSNHSSFNVTGSFENPAGFVTVLSLIFPVGLYWCLKSKLLEQRLVFFSLGLILFSIVISGSRTGILAIIAPSIVFLVFEFQLLLKIRNLKNSFQIYFLGIVILLSSLFFLYKSKSDSANGRVLIWNVTAEMIKEKPLFGFGFKGFKANYMNYQARYFELIPQSEFKYLADNVAHPFNEFLNIIVCFGIIGLLLYLSLLSFVIWKCFKLDYLQKNILLCCFTSFIVLSFFSYPLQYIPVWFFLGYLILILFSTSIRNVKINLFARILAVAACILGTIIFALKINDELKWKEIAIKSLEGATIKMLPNYAYLYPKMIDNELFLYNYGAELNIAEKYPESNRILLECSNNFNNYDLQMIVADNYYQTGKTEKAIQTYQHASYMIPCRFLPSYQIFQIYKNANHKTLATKYANEIINKKVKIPSIAVNSMKEEAQEYLQEN